MMTHQMCCLHTLSHIDFLSKTFSECEQKDTYKMCFVCVHSMYVVKFERDSLNITNYWP